MKTLVAIVGPSCAGKTFLMRKMQEKCGWTEIISTTTRAPRPDEIAGKTYHYVDDDGMENLLVSGQLMELVSFAGNQYGITKQAFEEAAEKSNGIAATIVIPDGLKQLESWNEENRSEYKIVSVYIDGKIEDLVARMITRANEAICEGSFCVDSFADRVASQVKEMRDWPTAHKYTLSVIEFNQHNTDNVVSLVELTVMR